MFHFTYQRSGSRSISAASSSQSAAEDLVRSMFPPGETITIFWPSAGPVSAYAYTISTTPIPCPFCGDDLVEPAADMCPLCEQDRDPGFLRWLESSAELDRERLGDRCYPTPADFEVK